MRFACGSTYGERSPGHKAWRSAGVHAAWGGLRRDGGGQSSASLSPYPSQPEFHIVPGPPWGLVASELGWLGHGLPGNQDLAVLYVAISFMPSGSIVLVL